MILIAWFVVALALFAAGALLWQPWWFMRLIQERWYCARCHKHVKIDERFRLQEEARENLEGRQV